MSYPGKESAAGTTARRWAVMAWSYGSCGSCDAYESDISGPTTIERLVEVLGDNLTEHGDERVAREQYAASKGW